MPDGRGGLLHVLQNGKTTLYGNKEECLKVHTPTLWVSMHGMVSTNGAGKQ